MTLFSAEHCDLQKQIHKDCPAYGQTSLIFAPMVSELIMTNKVKQLLDYGSGQGLLGKNLEVDYEIDVRLYDPAFPDIAAVPELAEMVVCIDVLDNIETDKVDAVLDDLKRTVNRVGFFAINTETSDSQELNIENTKCLFPVEWWLPKIMERFELHYMSRINYGFVVVVRARVPH